MAALEQKKSYFVSKDFKGLSNKNNRTAIDQDNFAWIENAQPIGFGNIKIVNAPSNVANVAFANTVTYLASANINNDEYIFAFQQDGSAQYVNIDTNTQGNLAAANTFSNANVQIAQWKNDRILIIDPANGYKTWDGTNLNSIGSVGLVTINNGGANYVSPVVTFDPPGEPGGVTATGEAVLIANTISQIIVTEAGYGYTSAPTITITDSGGGSGANVTCTLFNQSGTSVATFSGRAWIADGRTTYYSAADTFNDFTSVSSGFLTITDSTLRTDISTLVSANNFLYVFGEDSINVYSDVRVNSVTGETLFTNTNVSASIGSSFKRAIFPYFRSMLFLNRYGIYALVGATTSKISDEIDGLFEIIDFNEPITGGQVLINNILCAAWTFTIDDGSKRKVQAVFFDRKWFLTSQGDNITRTVSSVQSGNILLYGTTGQDLIKFYQDSTSGIEWEVITALWPMGDPIRDKQALKVGIEATFGTAFADMNVYIDSENQQSPPIVFQNTLAWVNNVNNIIPWVNTSGTQIGWISNTIPGGNTYYLYRYDARMYGKYLGLTLTGTTPPFTINGFQLEHELRARF